MAISSFSDLKAAMRDYLGIGDGSSYATNLDTAIAFAEARFNATLRNRRQLTSATLTVDANGEADVPTDYAGFARCKTTYGGGTVDLEEVSAEWMDDEFPLLNGGAPKYVAIDGDTFRFRPVPSDSVTLRYYAEIPALSDSNTSNWLLELQPSLYLAAALYEHSLLFDDPDGAQRFAAMMADQVGILAERDIAERINTRRLQVRGPTP